MIGLLASLLDTYATIDTITETLIDALEQNRFELVDDLVDQRAELIELAGASLKSLSDDTPDPLANEVSDALTHLISRDRRLRALIVSAVQANDNQLAQVRGSRARLGSYQVHNPDVPELVDRRG